MGYFLRKMACTVSRNDAHPLRRAAFLPPLPRKGCAYYYTILFGFLAFDHRVILEDKLNRQAFADA